ncbi:MAG: RluA family pseudouridine synthase [Oscillospiraceae bacterium]|nr:RluA family pseudouridine synthase [Oscillospiraceae bacterium]
MSLGERLCLSVLPEQEGQRIDLFLTKALPDQTRSFLQKSIKRGDVLVNDLPASKSARLKAGDRVTFRLPEPVQDAAQPEKMSLDIVYEDADLLVVNKPKGMVVHPAPGNYDGTLVNGLLYHCEGNLSGINGVIRPGIVHRIDKDTSGLLIVAKNDQAHRFLAAQIQAHSFTREYEAVVYGHLKEPEGRVDLPIGRSKKDRKKMAVTYEHSRSAITNYGLLQEYCDFSHIRCRLETGRTHQIRVHMAYMGHPLAGDPVYGPKKVIQSLHGQCLHAKKIGFIHPKTREYMEFNSDLPDYFVRFLADLPQK